MKPTNTPPGAVVVAALLLAPCGSLTGYAEETGPISGFPDASLTVFPLTVCWAGLEGRSEGELAWANAYTQGFRRDTARPLARILSLLLEEQGYERCQLADAEFEFPDRDAAMDARAAAFAKFVKGLGLKTDYALHAGILFDANDDRGGINDVFTIIVDGDGQVVWRDSPGRHARNEFEAAEAACERLAPALGLDKLTDKQLAGEKLRILQDIRDKQPPSGSEQAAAEKRREAMKQAGASARVLVFPARVGGDRTEAACAARLAELLNESKLCTATAAESGPLIEGGGWPNEQHVLFLFARNVRNYLRQHPADSEYALFTDYWFSPRGQVWAVHLVLCDRSGGWVTIDLQNSHSDDFRRLNPQNVEDCDRLVVERLRAELE